MRRIGLSALALTLTCLAAGCATVGPGVAGSLSPRGTGFNYAAGRATQTFAYPVATVQPAVVAALDDLRIQAVREVNDGNAIVFEGTTADDRRAALTLRPHPAGTRLSARVGWFGDEPLSRALMDRVGVRLGTLPPTAIPTEPPSTPGTNPYFSRSAVPDSVMLKDQAEARLRGSDSL